MNKLVFYELKKEMEPNLYLSCEVVKLIDSTGCSFLNFRMSGSRKLVRVKVTYLFFEKYDVDMRDVFIKCSKIIVNVLNAQGTQIIYVL